MIEDNKEGEACAQSKDHPPVDKVREELGLYKHDISGIFPKDHHLIISQRYDQHYD